MLKEARKDNCSSQFAATLNLIGFLCDSEWTALRVAPLRYQ